MLSARTALGVAARSTLRQYATAAIYSKHGIPENVLKVENITIPSSLGANEVLLRTLAAPINPADLNQIEGVYPITAPLPAVGGNEGVFVVEKVGSLVKGLGANDWVIPAKPAFGTWRTHAVVKDAEVLKIAPTIPVEYAATISVNPCTALRLLEDFAKLKPGDVIIQNAASSVVGQAVIQLAALNGVKTVNIIRKDRVNYADMVDRLKGLGGDIVVSDEYSRSPEMKHLLSDLPKPLLGLNAIGGESATDIVRLLGNGGTLVTYGGMSRKPVTVPTSSLIFKDITLRGFWLSKWLESHPQEDRLKMINSLSGLIASKKLKLFLEKHPFADFAFGLTKSRSPLRDRKLVLSFD